MPFELDKTALRQLAPAEALLTQAYKELFATRTRGGGSNLFEKLRRSAAYFVRSYQAEYYEDSVLQLSVAFEMLFGEGQTDRIAARVCNAIRFLLRETDDKATTEFRSLYDSRSGVAHEGVARTCDLNYCRQLYIRMICSLSRLVTNSRLSTSAHDPFSQYAKDSLRSKLGFVPEIP